MLTAADRRQIDMRFDAVRRLSGSIPRADRYRHTIEGVGVGGFIRFGGHTYLVEAIGRYDETDDEFEEKKGFSSYELVLFCIETGETRNLEWEIDDEVEVCVTTESLKFRDLRDDEGKEIDEDDLDQICGDEDDIVCNGDTYRYDDDWSAIFYRNGEGDGEKVFFYEFESQDGTEFLTIEEWVVGDKEEYQIFLSCPFDPNLIEVLVLGGQ